MIPDTVDTMTLQAVHAALDAGFRVTVTGLEIVGQPTFEQWERQGDTIWTDKQAAQWRTGDWLIAGEDLFGDDAAQAIDENRYSFHSLENIRYTCKAFPQCERRADVSFSNHSEVASLHGEQRAHALNMLASGAWNRNDVRVWKRELKGEQEKPKTKLVKVQPKLYRKRGKQLIVVFEDVPNDVLEWCVKIAA